MSNVPLTPPEHRASWCRKPCPLDEGYVAPEPDAIDLATDRLDKAAIAIGSCLVDGIDPDWDAQQEIEAACVAYVRALRGQKEPG